MRPGQASRQRGRYFLLRGPRVQAIHIVITRLDITPSCLRTEILLKIWFSIGRFLISAQLTEVCRGIICYYFLSYMDTITKGRYSRLRWKKGVRTGLGFITSFFQTEDSYAGRQGSKDNCPGDRTDRTSGRREKHFVLLFAIINLTRTVFCDSKVV